MNVRIFSRPVVSKVSLGIAVLSFTGLIAFAQSKEPDPASDRPIPEKHESVPHHNHESALDGEWTYRSFRSESDLSVPVGELLFGAGTLVLSEPEPGRLTGTLGGEGWSLDLTGDISGDDPKTFRFQGKGVIGGEEWVYDYLGYYVPVWPNGVDQVPAIVGSIVRTVPHSGGQAEAGYVAQWIATKKETIQPEQEEEEAGKPNASNQDGFGDDSAPSELNTRTPFPHPQAFKALLKDLDALEKWHRDSPNKSPKSSGNAYAPFVNPPVRSSNGTLLDTQLTIRYGTNKLYNPKLDRNIDLHHRSYEGALVGPTLKVSPGSMLRVKMINDLLMNEPHDGPINDPHNFNTTNLHTHGLHVSPAGNSDNVLIGIDPQDSFQNEIYIPPTHAPGTFWYHAHVHGSTAIQVASGMAGALIVSGGLDDVPQISAADEYILLFQQMPYRKSNDESQFEIESYDDFGPRQWEDGAAEIGWRTTISGQTYPAFYMAPGEVIRWRMINTGLREDVKPIIVPFTEAERILQEQLPQRQEVFRQLDGSDNKDENALHETKERFNHLIETSQRDLEEVAIDLHEIAADGLAYGRLWSRKSIDMSPGYRSDVLIRIDSPGLYVVLDQEASSEDSLHATHNSLKLLALIIVGGEPNKMTLPSNEQLGDLQPHPPITDKEISGQDVQEVTFFIDTAGNPVRYLINSQDYDPHRKPRTLTLGTASEWLLTSDFVNHPFHIHVNPFEIISIKDLTETSYFPGIQKANQFTCGRTPSLSKMTMRFAFE